MNKPKKYFNKYYVYGAIALVVLLLLAFLLLKSPKQGSIDLSFTDSKINSGESTFLEVQITNTGDNQLMGFFNVTIDSPSNINMSISSDRTEVNLLAGESVNRRIPITGLSENYRSDYEFVVYLYSNNTLIDQGSAILTVRR